MSASFSPENSLIFAAARRAASNAPVDFDTPHSPERHSTLEAEREWLSADSDSAAGVVRALFQNGIPCDANFYAQVESFCNHLGFAAPSEKKIGTQIWIAALRSLNQEDAEALLLAFAKTGHAFFRVHEGLPAVVDALSLPGRFAIEWFPALATRLGDDQATSGVWGAITRYCEVNRSAALETAEALAAREQSTIAMEIAAQMLGTLRSVTLEPAEDAKLLSLNKQLARSSSPTQRHCSLRSWISTARRGTMDINQLKAVLRQCEAGTPEDLAEGVGVVCRIACAAALNEQCLLAALAWLREKASSDLSIQSKHIITVAINAVADRCRSLADRPEANLLDLLNQILPIGPKCLGTWRVLESFLIKQSNHDKRGFEQTLQAIGERSPGVLYPLVRSDKIFTALLSKMAAQDNGQLVGRLMFQSAIGGRELGLALFECLGLAAFSTEMLSAIHEDDLRITLFVFQTLGVHGNVIARFFSAVAPRFEQSSEDAKREFSDELFVQCKNYPNACLASLKQLESQPEVIRAAVEKAEHYFKARTEVRASPLNAMQVPYYRWQAERKWRTMNREIHDKAEEQSVFAQLMKNVEMLYGDAFSSYDDANLSETTPMGEHSFEFEFPNLEFIAPEDMALRRLHALQMIHRLSESRKAQ
ncbi:MAG TPA: hypothetical protein VJU77_16730 [Chthoniobacterales bacterium]|nr:hypothetical protein [Chthoniobacterales bacterium]